MLLLSGITTILHTYFGTRLPLVQGSSFVYLAPALAIMNSREFRNLTEHVSTFHGSIILPEMIENTSSISMKSIFVSKVVSRTSDHAQGK